MSDKYVKEFKLPYANQNIPQTEEQKQEIIEKAAAAYGSFMDALKIDWKNDPHSSNTPLRVARAWVRDIASGCYDESPKITAFENLEKYDVMVFEGYTSKINL
jgi:GTP cyclohydrolase I